MVTQSTRRNFAELFGITRVCGTIIFDWIFCEDMKVPVPSSVNKVIKWLLYYGINANLFQASNS
jgi:hypothetical protein